MKISKKLLCLIMCLITLFTAGSLAVEAASIKVSVTAKLVAEATSDTVELRWRKVSKATGYKVYQRVDGKWKALKSVKTNKHIVEDLTASETYKFAVRTYRKYQGKTYWSKYKSVTAETEKMPKASAPKAAKATKTSITLKWAAVPGATGYRVYQYKGGDWVRIKSTTSNQYTVKSLKNNKSYKFKIKPYAKTSDGTVWGSSSKSATLKTYDPTKTEITSASATETTVTIKWSKVSGATGYRLSVLKNGEWSRVKSTSALSYTVKKLKPDTTYTYMVRAYKKVDGKVTWYAESDSKKVTTKKASEEPTTEPTTKPTTEPTTKPTTEPTTKPTTKPTTEPTTKPTTKPTTEPTTKPTTQPTTKPTTEPTTKPTTQPTTNPAYELRAFRIEKYKKILEGDTLYFKIKSDNGNGELADLEYAHKNGNIYVNATDSGINAKMYYEKKTDKMFAYFLLFYYEVPKAEWAEMDINEPLDEMKVQNLGSFISVSEDTFNGKKVICESYIDSKYGFIVKYYFDGETMVGLEKIYNNKSSQIIYVDKISTTVSDSLLKRPSSGYVDVSTMM